jgi:hypothetical protein
MELRSTGRRGARLTTRRRVCALAAAESRDDHWPCRIVIRDFGDR